MKKNKKKNPNKRFATVADVKKAQKEIDAHIEDAKNEGAMNATKLVKAIYFYVLMKEYGWDTEKLDELQDFAGEVGHRIVNDTDFSWDTLINELRENGIDTEGEE